MKKNLPKITILQCTVCDWITFEGWGVRAPMWRHVMLKHVRPEDEGKSKDKYWRHLYN